jgi:hypothetical protein
MVVPRGEAQAGSGRRRGRTASEPMARVTIAAAGSGASLSAAVRRRRVKFRPPLHVPARAGYRSESARAGSAKHDSDTSNRGPGTSDPGPGLQTIFPME